MKTETVVAVLAMLLVMLSAMLMAMVEILGVDSEELSVAVMAVAAVVDMDVAAVVEDVLTT
jgi:hypothetical protein